MDSQRRHQLQTNNLSLILLDLPGEIKAHASQIIMVVAILALIASLVYYRISARSHSLLQAQTDLATARSAIDQLQTPPPSTGDLKQYAAFRRGQASEAATALDQASSMTSDPKILAEVKVARGDLDWALANAVALPGASTQPALQLDQSQAGYLKDAEQAYNDVLNNYPDQKESIVAAKFGLAAVAENKHDWEMAQKLYDSLQSDPTITAAYRDLARNREEIMNSIKSPARIGTSKPTTQSVG